MLNRLVQVGEPVFRLVRGRLNSLPTSSSRPQQFSDLFRSWGTVYEHVLQKVEIK